MPNTTKQALEESLKHMLLKKPLDTITIRGHHRGVRHQPHGFLLPLQGHLRPGGVGLHRGCAKALQGKKTYETWQEGLLQIFEAVLENKPFILNAYRCIGREQMERFPLPADLWPDPGRGGGAEPGDRHHRGGQVLYR